MLYNDENSWIGVMDAAIFLKVDRQAIYSFSIKHARGHI